MFLNQLTEQNKEKFLQLCFYAALANSDFAKEEGEAISLYCMEMGLDPHVPEAETSLDDLLVSINTSTDDREKKIIFLEILGLFKTDGTIDENEQRFIDTVKTHLEIEDNDYSQFDSLLDRYTAVYKDLCNAIG